MGLKELHLECEYRSDESNLVEQFYIPCLTHSDQYWRAVGYFSSQGLTLAAKGLVELIRRSGTMRLVASPHLDPEDIEAIQKGYEAREVVIERALLRRFESDLRRGLSDLAEHRLGCLAWLIAEGRLEVKIAVPTGAWLTAGPPLYHEKIGIFLDKSDVVAFTGSANETIGGLVNNFESIDVFWSWDDPHNRVAKKVENFRRLWENETRGLSVHAFPEALKKRLLELKPKVLPDYDPEFPVTSKKVVSVNLLEPALPSDLELRKYQLDAIQAWLDAGGRGLLEMATGTGKTITSLAGTVKLLKKTGRLYIVVSAPYQHLVSQWATIATKFNFRPILAFRSRSTWENELTRRTMEYRFGIRKVVFVITTHTTFASDTFQKIISPVNLEALFLADEAHHLGATRRRMYLPENFFYRLGLSATPQRWYDENGTKDLMEYFGGTVFRFDLKAAIAAGCLTPYTYHPHLVELTGDEMETYEELTAKIAQLWGNRDNQSDEKSLLLEALLRKRANLLNRASNKLNTLRSILDSEPHLSHALFYCAPGQISEVINLLGKDLNLPVHQFTAEESIEQRRVLLENFEKGILRGLVAMKCLDEGVDVPATRSAYILASSGNPREFIQRRGRILRLAPGKSHARIYDLIAVPPQTIIRDQGLFRVERSIVRRELIRFKEFAEAAANHLQAIEVIWDLAKRYNLLDF